MTAREASTMRDMPCNPRTCLLVLALLLASAGAQRVAYVGSDGDWRSFLEAVPEAVGYDAWNRARRHPILALADLSPYTIELESHVRDGKLVHRAEGPLEDGLPQVQDAQRELRQKLVLPSHTQAVRVLRVEGLTYVDAELESPAGERHPVATDLTLEQPPGGEWHLHLKMRSWVQQHTFRLALQVEGWDLTLLQRFLRAYGPSRVLLVGELPGAARVALGEEFPTETWQPDPERRADRAVVSVSYRGALVGAHVAGLDDIPHLVHRASVARTKERLLALGVRHVTVLGDPENLTAASLVEQLTQDEALDQIDVKTRFYDPVEQDLCKRHYLSEAVVANPTDLEFEPWRSYPRSSLAAPVYGLVRRCGMLFVDGGDLERYQERRRFQNITFGVNGYQYGFAWEDVEQTWEQIADGIHYLDLCTTPYVTLIGGDHSIPCTFFIRDAWPAAEFPKLTFPENAVIYADASIYANVDPTDHRMEAGVGRLLGTVDEITTYVARLLVRRELEDPARVAAKRALLVFGPWGNRRDADGEPTFEELTTAKLEQAGSFDCVSFCGPAWGEDFLRHIGQARVFFANDFGYHNAAWGWSSYAHPGYPGPEASYNTQRFTLDFDAGYVVATSNGCATCDDKNRDHLHVGDSSLPVGLLFFRNGALGFFGMPNAARAEITTPLETLATGRTLGEAIRQHLNDRLRKPEQGGLFGGPEGWKAEVPGYDTLHETHPLLYPMTKQDGLVLFGDPHARLDPPPAGTYLELARGAADWLVATARQDAHGLDLTGGKTPAESAYGQTGAGAAIFLVHLYEATGEKRYLAAAREAARWIEHVTASDDDRVPGLFVGDSGKGLLYLELARVTGKQRYRKLALAVAQHFSGDWTYEKNGQPYWTTDLYLGAAGHILFLLELYEAWPSRRCLDEARRAGDFLIEHAHERGQDPVQYSWAIEPWRTGPDFYYTGMAHGAAGISYALAKLHRATRDERFLAHAEGGARLVMDRALPEGDGYRWYARYSPDPHQIKYQWCHGPPGILLMFLELYEATGKEVYRTWAERTARTAARPGKYFRLDMSLCHGPPGNGDCFLEAYRALQDPVYLEVARDHGELAREYALRQPEGLDWWYANRTYMNGVAGVGHFFLRLAEPGRFRPALIAK
jgi:rhamnogalacturonyl hydrolase YesR